MTALINKFCTWRIQGDYDIPFTVLLKNGLKIELDILFDKKILEKMSCFSYFFNKLTTKNSDLEGMQPLGLLHPEPFLLEPWSMVTFIVSGILRNEGTLGNGGVHL